jgi:hypothetical protein
MQPWYRYASCSLKETIWWREIEWRNKTLSVMLTVANKVVRTAILLWKKIRVHADYKKMTYSYFVCSPNMTIHYHDNSPTRHFDNMAMHQHDNSPIYNSLTWQFANMTIRQHDVLSPTCHLTQFVFLRWAQCCGSGIRCFSPGIRDPPGSGSGIL